MFAAGERTAEMPPIGEISDLFTSLNMCVAGCGGLCLLIGITKCCIDDRQRSIMAWTVSGLTKIVTTLVVYNTPDTDFNLLCCLGCILGLIIAIIGSLVDILMSCNNNPRSDQEFFEGLMLTGSVISSISMFIKGLGYFLFSS